MKAITIWQPWATLLPLGIKLYETRSWATSYRGPIAIHAAAVKVQQIIKRCFSTESGKQAFLDVIAKGMNGVHTEKEVVELMNSFPTGSVVGVAQIVGCCEIFVGCDGKPFIRTSHGIYKPTYRERMLGDWTPGRYAWEFSDMRPVDPIPAKGKQGLWTWDETGGNAI